MGLDVDTPEPPSLRDERDVQEYDDVDVMAEGDYRRDELESFLRDGAWEEAFGQWTEHAEMDETEFNIARDLDLFREFDFFWDDFAGRVGYHAPGLPEDWKQRDLHPDIDSWSTVSSINAGLTEFGQTVCDVLADHYIDWESEFEAPDDLPEF